MERRLITSGSIWEQAVGYSRAVRVADLVFVAGTTAAHPSGGAVGGDDVAAQTRETLRRIETALLEAGSSLDDVVRTRLFVTDISKWEDVGRVHGEYFVGIQPASTMVEVSALIDPSLQVEIEAVAVIRSTDAEAEVSQLRI